MYPNPRGRAHEADQFERENEERMGQLHNRISNLKNVRAQFGGVSVVCTLMLLLLCTPQARTRTYEPKQCRTLFDVHIYTPSNTVSPYDHRLPSQSAMKCEIKIERST